MEFISRRKPIALQCVAQQLIARRGLGMATQGEIRSVMQSHAQGQQFIMPLDTYQVLC